MSDNVRMNLNNDKDPTGETGRLTTDHRSLQLFTLNNSFNFPEMLRILASDFKIIVPNQSKSTSDVHRALAPHGRGSEN